MKARVQRVGLHDAVKSNSEAAANNESGAEFMPGEFSRTPGKAELRAEVRFLGIVLAAASAGAHVGEKTGPGAKHHGGQFPVLLRNRAKVLPAQTRGQRQVGAHFVVVLKEKTDEIVSEVFTENRRHSGLGIELRVLRHRSIVEKVPNVVERVAGTTGPGRSVNGEQTGKLPAHLHGVRAMNFGEHILGPVGPLVEGVEGADSVSFNRIAAAGANAASGIKADLRQSEWCVGIQCEILIHPAGGIHARLVNQAGAKRVVPDRRCRTVRVAAVEHVHRGVAIPIKARAGVRHVVEADGNQVLASGIKVHAAVVLPLAAAVGLNGALIESYVRSVRQVVSTATSVAAGAGAVVADVTGVARADRSGQRRAEGQSLASDEAAVSTFHQTDVGAGVIHNRAAVGSNTWKSEKFCSVCSGSHQDAKLRSLIPATASPLLGIVAQRFVGEEAEEPVMQDGPSGRAAPVVEAVVIGPVAVLGWFCYRIVAVVPCVGIQTRAVRLEIEAAVILVGPVLGDDLNLRAAVATVFCVVVVGDDFDFLDGVLVGCDDGSTAPGDAGG